MTTLTLLPRFWLGRLSAVAYRLQQSGVAQRLNQLSDGQR